MDFFKKIEHKIDNIVYGKYKYRQRRNRKNIKEGYGMNLENLNELLEAKSRVSMAQIEEFAYPELALIMKVIFDKIEQANKIELDMNEKIDLSIKFFRYVAKKPSKLRQEMRRLIGAKPKKVARDMFLSVMGYED